MATEENTLSSSYKELASYRNFIQNAQAQWKSFLEQRNEKLAQQGRFDRAPEKVAENIVGTLLTTVLGWEEKDLNWQLNRADLVITRNLVKHILIETKHPGSLKNKRSIDVALDQAWRYASEQHVSRVAICDGFLFYGTDIGSGGLRPRTVFKLTQREAPHDALWWVSLDGIWRTCEVEPDMSLLQDETHALTNEEKIENISGEILHPKYQLPARCFAYVGNPSKTSTWKLPYLLIDGNTDSRRLPKAIQALASNYRGAKVTGIPDNAIPDVFRRLETAASAVGKMPEKGIQSASIYYLLAEIIEQLNAAGK